MKSKLLVAVTLVALFLTTIGLSSAQERKDSPPPPAQDETQKAAPCCEEVPEHHFTLETDDKGVVKLTAEGSAKLVPIEAKKADPTPRTYRVQGEVVELGADCTTGPTGTGGRTACWSDWTVVSCPEGYAFDKEAVAVHREIEYGSENNVYVVWENYVRIHPSAPFTAPRTIKVQVHARSGDGYGERGRTKVRVVASYFKL